jgi:hypothetical protein
MTQSDQQLFDNQSKSQLWFKIYLTVMMCLAGSLIYLIFTIRGIRGLDLSIWCLVGILFIIMGLLVYCWPMKSKPTAGLPNQDPDYWETEQDRKAEFVASCLEKLHVNRKRL